MGRVAAASIILLNVAVISGQGTLPTAFEVASVKPSAADPPRLLFGSLSAPPPGQWRAIRLTLVQLIAHAYPAYAFDGLVVGGPAWIRDKLFDVNARMDPNTAPPQAAAMVAHLLATRFAFRSHIERRFVPVYVLEMARADGALGPQLKRSAAACIEAREARRALPRECRGQFVANGGLNLSAVTAADFVRYLASAQLDRPVIDRSGLTGYLDFRLTYDCGPFNRQLGRGPCDGAGRSFFTALEEQAALKIRPSRELVDVLVIDSVSMPEPD